MAQGLRVPNGRVSFPCEGIAGFPETFGGISRYRAQPGVFTEYRNMLTKTGNKWLWKGQEVPELKGADANKALEWANQKMAALESNQRGVRKDPTNADFKLDGHKLTITMDLSKDFGRSKGGEGKSIIVATTHGNFPLTVPGVGQVMIGINAYRK